MTTEFKFKIANYIFFSKVLFRRECEIFLQEGPGSKKSFLCLDIFICSLSLVSEQKHIYKQFLSSHVNQYLAIAFYLNLSEFIILYMFFNCFESMKSLTFIPLMFLFHLINITPSVIFDFDPFPYKENNIQETIIILRLTRLVAHINSTTITYSLL